ncbi:MAG: DUF960 family protein [Lutispora sp.]|nr:DUF960 family protein [Lutispora sp.]
MFDGQKYVTCGVNSSVDPNIQLFIWNLIENLKSKIQLDYLQVFELSKIIYLGKPAQKLTHSQEIPYHTQEYILSNDEPVDQKIYIIDDYTHSTMLLAEEY